MVADAPLDEADVQTLPDRQAQTLQFICAHIVRTERAPTNREISAELKFRSNNPAALVEPLIKKGYLTKLSRSARNLRPTDKAWAWFKAQPPSPEQTKFFI